MTGVALECRFAIGREGVCEASLRSHRAKWRSVVGARDDVGHPPEMASNLEGWGAIGIGNSAYVCSFRRLRGIIDSVFWRNSKSMPSNSKEVLGSGSGTTCLMSAMPSTEKLVLVLDNTGHSLMASASWERLGLAPRQLVGSHCSALWQSVDWSEVEEAAAGSTGRAPTWQASVAALDGERHQVEWALLGGDAGTFVAVGQLCEEAPDEPLPDGATCACVVASDRTLLPVACERAGSSPSQPPRRLRTCPNGEHQAVEEAFARVLAGAPEVRLSPPEQAGQAQSRRVARLIQMVCEGDRRTVLVMCETPMRRESNAPVRSPASVEPGSVSGTVLLVDDDALVRSALERYLARAGYQILLASDGDHALQVLKRHPDEVHAVVTDVRMPRRDGSSLAGELRRLRPSLPVLALTGYSDDLSRDTLAALGVPVLDKPIAPSEIVREVERLRGNHHRQGAR